jgi:DNA-binding NarL/FixJ family response regulator
MINLFAIDDHFLIIEGLYKSFNPDSKDVEVVGSALSVEEALEKLALIPIDIIVLDLFIGQSDPVSNFQRLRAAFPSIPIVILSMEDTLSWKVKMFQLGVNAFLNKGDSKETMNDVFIQVAAGKFVISEEVNRAMKSKPFPI